MLLQHTRKVEYVLQMYEKGKNALIFMECSHLTELYFSLYMAVQGLQNREDLV